MQKELKAKYDKLLNIKEILNNTINSNKLKVTLKWSRDKGIGLFATKNIKQGELISYYKISVFNYKKYNSPTNNIYAFDVYNKKEKPLKSMIGDIDLNSLPAPFNNIPFWAPFANEASEENSNAEMDIDTNFNYRNKNKINVGDNIIYKLIAKNNIKKGEEINWYYGPDYFRNYVLD